MADLAHSLLSAALPSRTAVNSLSRSVQAAALELAAAVSEYHHLASLRYDPDRTRSEGVRDATADIRYRHLARQRSWRALEDYLRAVRELTAEASRGAFFCETEALAHDHHDAFRAYFVSTSFELDIPF